MRSRDIGCNNALAQQCGLCGLTILLANSGEHEDPFCALILYFTIRHLEVSSLRATLLKLLTMLICIRALPTTTFLKVLYSLIGKSKALSVVL
jgi:hypothetical protein